MALGAALLFTGACHAADDTSGPGAAPASASATADNTAALCKSGGEASRTAVLGLFGKLAELTGGDTPPGEADLVRVYQSTFGTLRDELLGSSATATDPRFAAVLKKVAAEADKLATAADPQALGTKGLEATLGELEKFCPREGTTGASTAPGGLVAGAIGAPGSACVLPVTFAVPDRWKPASMEMADDDPLAELTRKGPLRMACEISARPAGLTGFLRVWIDPRNTTDGTAALQSFLTGAKSRDVVYTPATFGGRDGVEVRYRLYSTLLEEYSDRRAFAVPTPSGAVVVELSGLESDDPVLRSAYEQARSTLKTTS